MPPLDAFTAAQQAERAFDHRTVLASQAELIISICVASIAPAFVFVTYLRVYDDPIRAVSGAFGDPVTLALLLVLFIEIFSYLLNRRTIIIGLLTYVHRRKLSERSLKEVASFGLTYSESDFVDLGIQPPSRDEFIHQISELITRSKSTAQSYQRRPNALLFAGGIVAAVGLVFFVFTLPGILRPFDEINSTDILRSLVILLPRLLMLIFIQILAGFFLRQYRTAIEDSRYYEQIMRQR